VPAEDSEDEINKPRLELSSTAHPGDSALRLSDCLEDALKKRLETFKEER